MRLLLFDIPLTSVFIKEGRNKINLYLPTYKSLRKKLLLQKVIKKNSQKCVLENPIFLAHFCRII